MNPLTYEKATSSTDALERHDGDAAKFLGAGTNLVDLMREGIATPTRLIDVTGLAQSIEEQSDGGLRIGAGVSNTAVADDATIRAQYPALSRAILAGASAQIRNMATVGGNILQRTRCSYFYDVAGSRCNKRTPGEGCDAIDGFNRAHGILGVSDSCIATHPSDMSVALSLYDAVINVESEQGTRSIPINDFYVLPGDTPDIENQLNPGELIVSVDLPAPSANRRATYRKVRDRASYAFALVSVAGSLIIEDGLVVDAGIALGGVAPKPWRATEAEAGIVGSPPTEEVFRNAAQIALADATTQPGNVFKPELAQRVIVAVLQDLAGDAQ